MILCSVCGDDFGVCLGVERGSVNSSMSNLFGSSRNLDGGGGGGGTVVGVGSFRGAAGVFAGIARSLPVRVHSFMNFNQKPTPAALGGSGRLMYESDFGFFLASRSSEVDVELTAVPSLSVTSS